MKYSYILTFDSGEIIRGEDDSEIFDSENEAYEGALYAISCCHQGAEILHMSNPGDYPPDDEDNDPEINIVEIEE